MNEVLSDKVIKIHTCKWIYPLSFLWIRINELPFLCHLPSFEIKFETKFSPLLISFHLKHTEIKYCRSVNDDHDDDEICRGEKRNKSNKRRKVEMELSWKLNFFHCFSFENENKTESKKKSRMNASFEIINEENLFVLIQIFLRLSSLGCSLFYVWRLSKNIQPHSDIRIYFIIAYKTYLSMYNTIKIKHKKQIHRELKWNKFFVLANILGLRKIPVISQ